MSFRQLCRSVSTVQHYLGRFPLCWTTNEEETDGYSQTQMSHLVFRPKGQEKNGFEKNSKTFTNKTKVFFGPRCYIWKKNKKKDKSNSLFTLGVYTLRVLLVT